MKNGSCILLLTIFSEKKLRDISDSRQKQVKQLTVIKNFDYTAKTRQKIRQSWETEQDYY